jgi:hypothetical protein
MNFEKIHTPPLFLLTGKMNLILISNVPHEISLAQTAGIQTVLIDLERETKIERQQGKGLFISDHTMDDLRLIRNSFPDLTILTRINSLHKNSDLEVENVLAAGTVAIKIPFIQKLNELRQFDSYINNRCTLIPLFETIWSVTNIEKCLDTIETDTCHFGLNDLALEQGWSSIFTAFEWPPFQHALDIVRKRGMQFGIAGIGNQLDTSLPVHPSDFFIQQIKQGGTRFWLSRNFRKIFQSSQAQPLLQQNIEMLQQHYNTYAQQQKITFTEMPS